MKKFIKKNKIVIIGFVIIKMVFLLYTQPNSEVFWGATETSLGLSVFIIIVYYMAKNNVRQVQDNFLWM